eukprot:UN00587
MKGKVALWKGDCTKLKIEAIVNAANEKMLGCFTPMHRCIDNVIHCASGPRLRMECCKKMGGKEVKPGEAILTKGYHLPCDYIIHTCGPRGKKPDVLKQSYNNCLDIGKKNNIKSISYR